jgi:hypothetical protein
MMVQQIKDHWLTHYDQINLIIFIILSFFNHFLSIFSIIYLQFYIYFNLLTF